MPSIDEFKRLDKILCLRDETQYKTEKRVAAKKAEQIANKYSITQEAYDCWQDTIGRTPRK